MSESEESISHTTYTIEAVARITRIPKEEIVVYYQSGFVSPLPAKDKSDPLFDEEAVHQLRRLAFLLSEYRLNRDGLKIVSSLLSEVERLRAELRFLREN